MLSKFHQERTRRDERAVFFGRLGKEGDLLFALLRGLKRA